MYEEQKMKRKQREKLTKDQQSESERKSKKKTRKKQTCGFINYWNSSQNLLQQITIANKQKLRNNNY